MVTEFTFLIPLGWQKRAERLDFAYKHDLGLEITAFIGGKMLNEPESRMKMEDDLARELSGFPGTKTMHGAFLDLALHSPDQSIADISRSRIESDILTALRLRCEKLVFHLGFNPLVPVQRYRKEVVHTHAEFWDYVLSTYPGISICLENQWENDWSIFSELFDRVQHPRFGMCLDVAHAHVYSHFSPESWIRGMAAEVLHMHWNDNRGDRDSHRPIGKGNIDWTSILKACCAWKQMTVTLELNDLRAIERSLIYLAQEGLPIRDKFYPLATAFPVLTPP